MDLDSSLVVFGILVVCSLLSLLFSLFASQRRLGRRRTGQPSFGDVAARVNRKLAPLLAVGLVIAGVAVGVSQLRQASLRDNDPSQASPQKAQTAPDIEIARLSAQIQTLDTRLAERVLEIRTLKEQVNAFEQSKRDSDAEAIQQQRLADDLRTRLSTAQSSYGRSQTRVLELTANLIEAAETIERYESEFQRQRVHVDELRKKIAKVRANSAEIERRLVNRTADSARPTRRTTQRVSTAANTLDESGWRAVPTADSPAGSSYRDLGPRIMLEW